MNRNVCSVAVIAMLTFAGARAQNFNASISGTVTDPTGLVIPGASVAAKNVETNLTVQAQSGADGNFVLASLPPGSYDLTATAAGFKTYSRQGVALAIGDKATVDFRMQLGDASQSIAVNGSLSAVETDQTVMSLVTTGKEAAEVPLEGRQIFQLLLLSAGVTQSYVGTDQRDTGWSFNGDYSMFGGRPGTSSYVVDGAPMGSKGMWTFAPLTDAVQEFKIASPITDASYGLTGGGVVSVSMKSGTNAIHGSLSEFLRNAKLDAAQTQFNQALASSPFLTRENTWNMFSGMIGGPIIRNKFFYTGYYDGARILDGQAATYSIPTMLQRTGDFSQTYNSAHQLVTIYDPLTTKLVNGRYVRTAFPGNIIPPSRIAKPSMAMLGVLPGPNIVTDPVTNLNNYETAFPSSIIENNIYWKLDYIWNENNRSMASHTYTWDSNNGSIYYGNNNPANAGTLQQRRHEAATLAHVWNIGNSGFVMNARLAFDRWWADVSPVNQMNSDVSSYGFQGQTGITPTNHFPLVTFSGYSTLGNGNFNVDVRNMYSGMVDVSKNIGRHFVRFGGIVSNNIFSTYASPYTYGYFQFNPAFTQQDAQSSSPAAGNSIASFLLGYPAGGQTQNNTALTYGNREYGMYVQDDLRLSKRVTLNYGLRWDIQTAPTERYNRQIYAFDPSLSYQLGPGTAHGGFIFADKNHRQPWDTKYRDFQPRLGIAVGMTRRITFRGGYGMSFLPENGTLGGGGIQADGFNATTNMIVTTGSGASVYIPGLPGTGTFVNPFPNGVLAPYGSSLGPLTEVGQSVSFTQRGFLQGRVHQFYAGVNVELPWKLVALVDYVGTLTRDLRITAPLNVLPLSIQNQIAANPSLLTQSEPNPFYGAPQLAGTTLNTPTLSYSQANLPFPQFTGVNDTGSPRGRAKYNGLELRVQRRFVEGLTLSVNYTFSKTMEALTYNSNKFTVPWVISPFDRSQNLNIVSLWELPVGKGKYFGRNWSPVLNQAFGGWQINAAFTYMTGIPTPIPAGALSVGDPRLVQPTLSQWFNTCTVLTNGNRANCASPNQPVAWQQPAPGQIVYNSTYFPSIRNAWEPQLHVSAFKWFQILERLRLEFRAEAYNITNTPIYGPPNTNFNTANFGVVTPSQINRSRNMQLALRLLF